MRKTIYNFLGENDFAAKNKSANFKSEVAVSNNTKFSSAKKWVSFLLIMLLSFSVKSQISLTATTGTTSGSYTTLKAAFDAINAGTHTGAISISVTASTTETAQAVLNFSGSGSASFTSVNISPAAATTPTISGSISGSALVKLNGSDNVVIDGSNNGSTSRDLTFTNTAVATSTAVFWIGSISSNGATGNTIKNCNINCTNRVVCLAGIYSSSAATITTAAVAANSNNTYSNNAISRTLSGITLNGFSSMDAGTTISGNNIDSVGSFGLNLINQQTYNVYNNVIDKASNNSNSTNTIYGIIIQTSHSSGNIYNNKILYLRQNNAGLNNISARGISLNASTTTSNVTVYNNFIGNVSAYGFANGAVVYGLYASTGGGYKIYNNTVHLTTLVVI
jgi:hypothetical protein